jgi:hypothetical protein
MVAELRSADGGSRFSPQIMTAEAGFCHDFVAEFDFPFLWFFNGVYSLTPQGSL